MRLKFLVLPLLLIVSACGGGGNSSGPASSPILNPNSIYPLAAPPILPQYEQPVCPGEGHIWTPGYWGYDSHVSDYYWVPGTWVAAPEPGLLWTPPYWAWNGSTYVFTEGWWGPHVGFYGGISYGFGYFGSGYQGGAWNRGQFFYNQMVSNVDITIVHNVYRGAVYNNTNVVRISYNGGEGGIRAYATLEEQTNAQERRNTPPTPEQVRHAEAARIEPQLRASANHGVPPIAATTRPGAFSGRDVVCAREEGVVHNPKAPEAPAATSTPQRHAPVMTEPASHGNQPQPHVEARPATPRSERALEKEQEKPVSPASGPSSKPIESKNPRAEQPTPRSIAPQRLVPTQERRATTVAPTERVRPEASAEAGKQNSNSAESFKEIRK